MGEVQIRYPEPLIAGRLVTVVFDYTVGPEGMAEDGRLRIGLPSVAWAKPEVPQYYFWSEFARGKNRRYTQYDRVNTTAQIDTSGSAVSLLETEARFFRPWQGKPRWLTEYDRFWITVTLEDGGLSEGDRIVVTYGDPQQLPLTACIQGMPEERINFMVLVDSRGDGQFHHAANSPWMADVQSGPVSQIDVITPSIARPGRAIETLVSYSDEVKTRAQPTPTIGSLCVHTPGGAMNRVKIDREADFAHVQTSTILNDGDTAQPVCVTVTDTERGWQSHSNPTLVRADGPLLFWGDMHGQSQYHGWSDEDQKGMSCHLPRECYRYARDIAGLDFCAVTDTASIAKDIWQDTMAQAAEMYEPGQFVTFYGSEVGDDRNGHRNLLFGGDQPQEPIKAVIQNAKGTGWADLETPRMQQRYADRNDVLLVPHHVKMWMTWDCHMPALEPVMEIYSVWGSCEKAGTDLWEILREMTGGAQEAWARGYRIGVIAGSDTHAGLPGRSIPGCDRDDFMPYKAGIAGVWADELNRESIFAALKRRHCYGTTGARIILETFIDGNPMGSEVDWQDPLRTREFCVNVWGTDSLRSVTVVKNNVDVHTISPQSDSAELAWEDKSRADHNDYYYARIVQQDGNRAWSSPIWLNA